MSVSITFEELVQKLKKSLGKDSDFPASAKVISELQKLANDPRSTAQQMTDVILKEPSLGTKILSIVNSAYFRRVKPILTVSEAVVVLGSRQIADLCSSLLILNKFSGNNAHSNLNKSLQKSVFTGLISSSLFEANKSEIGFLVGVLRNFGEVLINYYFPELGAKLCSIASAKNVTVEDSFRLAFQRELLEVLIEVLQSINLPKFYHDILRTSIVINHPKSTHSFDKSLLERATALELSNEVSKLVVDGKEIDYPHLASKYPGFNQADISKAVNLAYETLDKFEELTNIDFSAVKSNKHKYIQQVASQFIKNDHLLEPLKQAIGRNANTATLLLMATDIIKQTFSRVLLYLKSKEEQVLKIRIFEGSKEGFTESNLVVPLDKTHIITDALKVGKPTFPQTGLFKDSYPVVCIPIGNIKTPVAVIYFDRKETSSTALELSDREKDLINKLYVLINQSLKSVHASTDR